MPSIFACLVAFIAAPPSGAGPGWQAALQKPLSPGSVALLVEHATEPAVRARWAEALITERPDVRAAAARVANVTASTSLLPDLLKALAAETDSGAADEEIAAVAALGGPVHDGDLLEVARRQPRFAAAVVAALGRARGKEALARLKDLRSLSLRPAQLESFLNLATAGNLEALQAAASAALAEGDASTWAAVLQISRRHRAPLPDDLLARSVRSPSSPMRAQTYWHLLLAPRWQPSPELREALDTSVEAAAVPEAPREDLGVGFAFELLQRLYRRPPREDRGWIESVQQGGPIGVLSAVLHDREILARMLPSELRALSARVAGGPDGLAARLNEKPPSPGPNAPRVSETEWPPVQRTVAMHTADWFPRGFVADVFAVAGCRGGENTFGGGRVTYARDGRPREVAFLKDDPGPCSDAVRVLVLSSLIRSDRLPRPDQPELVIVPLSREAEGCSVVAAGLAPADDGPDEPALRVGAEIREPKKIRNVPPVYPEAARQEHVQGTVVLEAIIASSGCVEAVEVQQSPDPRLSVAALVAVSRWRYTPTLLDGRPVPVIMHVTVNFRLS